MEPKDIAAKAIEMVKNKEMEKIIPLIEEQYEEEDVLKNLVSVQIQMKEKGGGYPPVGKQITTIDEIIAYSDLAIDYVKHIFALFQWDDIAQNTLREHQKKLLERK